VSVRLRFTVLVDLDLPARDLQGNPLLASERGADRLAAALTELGHDVVLLEAPLATVAPDRWILYFGCDPGEALARSGARRSTIRNRLIIVDEDRVTAGELTEAVAPALVVTSRSFRNWLNNSRAEAQVFKRTAVAHALKIVLPHEDMVARCSLFTIRGAPLPEGIGRYCVALGLGGGAGFLSMLRGLVGRFGSRR